MRPVEGTFIILYVEFGSARIGPRIPQHGRDAERIERDGGVIDELRFWARGEWVFGLDQRRAQREGDGTKPRLYNGGRHRTVTGVLHNFPERS